MRENDMAVNLITYNAAIAALSKASRYNTRKRSLNKGAKGVEMKVGNDGEELWTRAMFLLKQMRQDGIEPDGFSFSSAISCCGAEGRWEEALELMKVMKSGGPRTRPNKIAYTAAICKFCTRGSSLNGCAAPNISNLLQRNPFCGFGISRLWTGWKVRRRHGSLSKHARRGIVR